MPKSTAVVSLQHPAPAFADRHEHDR